jgi:hypothetical protein
VYPCSRRYLSDWQNERSSAYGQAPKGGRGAEEATERERERERQAWGFARVLEARCRSSKVFGGCCFFFLDTLGKDKTRGGIVSDFRALDDGRLIVEGGGGKGGALIVEVAWRG